MGLSLRCLHIRDAIDHMGRHGFSRLHFLGFHPWGDVKNKAIVSREKTLRFLGRLLLAHILCFGRVSVFSVRG